MVDTTDLKSVDLIGREGSSPSTPIKLEGRILGIRKFVERLNKICNITNLLIFFVIVKKFNKENAKMFTNTINNNLY